MTTTPTAIPRSTTQQITEICFTVGQANMINRFHGPFSTELDRIIHVAVGDPCPLAHPEPPEDH